MACAFGCARPTEASPGNVPAANLPPYTANDALLFDDSIASDTVDSSYVDASIAARRRLSERTRRADVVATVRVATVSELGKAFDLTLEPVEAPFRGKPPSSALSLTVSSRQPAYRFLETQRRQLVGGTVIVFLKNFNVEGAVETHFRIEPNSPAMRQSIQQAAMLSELGS